MFSIHVERLIDKPIETVFDILTDHGNYHQFNPIEQSKLLKSGAKDKNGLGAVREIKAKGGILHEEIVAYERPYKMGYKIIKSQPLPYDHQLGEITLSEENGQTRVIWRSIGHINIPILGTLFFDRQVEKLGSRAFGSILKTIGNI